MTPVVAPADRRLRRARVSPARRRSSRLPRAAVRAAAAALCLGGALYAGARAVLSADALRVSTVTVAGNVWMPTGEVLALLDGLRGAHMVTADLEEWRQRLRRSPWVADAAIRRVLPSGVHVDISERQPMGVARIDGALYLVDQQGTIIDEFGPNHAEFDLPLIDGLRGGAHGEDVLDAARAALAGRVLREVQAHPDLARRVSQIDVSDPRNAEVILEGDTAILRLGDERFAERLRSYLELAPLLREQTPAIDYVDLRFDRRVYVRPQGGKRGS